VRILVVGGGGREHALCWRLAQNPAVDRLYAAPGNAGIAEIATLVPVSAADVQGVVEFAERESIDFTVVGPEAPLVAGMADEMQARGMPVFGPTRDAARIEGSKAWARWLCDRHDIPAPESETFDAVEPAFEYLEKVGPPYVVKADGIAAGKGVTVTEDIEEARRSTEDCLVRKVFGEAGLRVLIEEHLEGFEVSAMALTDGRTLVPLAMVQDYKRALDGNRGPNTGGMGAFSPVPAVGSATEARIVEMILRRAARALEAEGVRYRGVLFAGLMLTASGPKVLEFNCRFGDPETQAVLPRLQSDLVELCLASRQDGGLAGLEAKFSDEWAVTVALASRGYPASSSKGDVIHGLEEARGPGVEVFHAGTARRDGELVTAGGRVLNVTGLGPTPDAARERAYDAARRIRFDGMLMRTDIATRAVERAAAG
jgi:phosphoribosylamine---glycine ligase